MQQQRFHLDIPISRPGIRIWLVAYPNGIVGCCIFTGNVDEWFVRAAVPGLVVYCTRIFALTLPPEQALLVVKRHGLIIHVPTHCVIPELDCGLNGGEFSEMEVSIGDPDTDLGRGICNVTDNYLVIALGWKNLSDI